MAKLDWKSKEGLAVGKGATVQEFVAISGKDTLEIDVAPWGLTIVAAYERFPARAELLRHACQL